MSRRLSAMVDDRYPCGGGELLLALALADRAHDDGTNIYPSVAYLARRSRQSDRTVQKQLRKMEACGFLIFVKCEQRGRAGFEKKERRGREYAINPRWIAGASLSTAVESIEQLNEEKGEDSSPFNSDGKGCSPEQKRVKLEAEKGEAAAAPDTKANLKTKESTHARAGDADAQQQQLDLDLPAPFPLSWKPDDECNKALEAQSVPLLQQWQIALFVGQWLGKSIAPRKIPGEYLKWAAREHGFRLRDTERAVDTPSQQAAVNADPEQRAQADLAFERLRELNKRNALSRSDVTGASLAATKAIGGTGAFDSVEARDVPKLRSKFVAAYCEYLQRGGQ